MNCEKCGEVCQCPMEPLPTHLPGQNSAGDTPDEAMVNVPGLSPDVADESEWRNEISARLDRYRSRRKAPPPRYPSLRLPFEPITTHKTAPLTAAVPVQSFEPAASSALALDRTAVEDAHLDEPAELSAIAEPQPSSPASHTGAKIIEFPRFAWAPPPPPPDQLAEPVVDVPRILEVPEVAPPPPALGGITIEPVRVHEPEKRPGIDIPSQRAPLGLRLLASVVDGAIIAAASALFGFIFWKIALVRPPQLQVYALAAGIPCLFWAAYRYLLLVYAGTTPGLRLARLELCKFDGAPTKRSVRRWRVLASYLSAASLGMGYAWLFLDEDTLCWHDRITRTYFAPRRKGRG